MGLQLLHDCDNTMGIREKDIDDGLALLYLAGRRDVEICGITSVFGNGDIEQVDRATRDLCEEFGLHQLDYYTGAASSDDLETGAVDFLLKQVADRSGNLELLATGPLTNIKAARYRDSNFFKKLKSVAVMGGINEPLIFAGEEMEELNFSCDPGAARLVLQAETPVMVASGNLCLQALFNGEDLQRLEREIPRFLPYVKDWYQFGQEIIGQRGFYMWDPVAAVYLTNPELFEEQNYRCHSTEEDLRTGRLILEKTNESSARAGVINLPRQIKDIDKFKNLLFHSWSNFSEGVF